MQTLSQSIKQYLEMCKYERNLSPDTLKAYQIDLQQFSEFTNQAWADRDALNSYINYLNMRFAPRSVKRKLASVRAFYHELEYNGVLEENPFHKSSARGSPPCTARWRADRQRLHTATGCLRFWREPSAC